jgi:hypothetical protein
MIRGLAVGDPRQVGPYRLLARLGSGGMGSVFLARSAGGQLLAVKVIRADLADELGFRARFAREVTAARKVSGRHTAVLVDADPDAPMPWLATSYVPGLSLAETVGRHGPLPAATVLTLAAGLAEALSVIHAAGVVHRDLKPSNVLIADDGPRVIDFGISRALGATALTLAGSVMGSPGFMSPEQALGLRAGPPSDVFCLGALLTFAATGQGPFGTGSMPALLYRVVHGPPTLDRLPGELRGLILRCLVKDPGQRATTGELLAQLGTAHTAVDWLPGPVAESVSRFGAPIPAAAELALATVTPASITPAPAVVTLAPITPVSAAVVPAPVMPGQAAVAPGRWAARMPVAAAAAGVAVAAAGVAVDDQPTLDFRMTDPSVPGLPLSLDGGLSAARSWPPADGAPPEISQPPAEGAPPENSRPPAHGPPLESSHPRADSASPEDSRPPVGGGPSVMTMARQRALAAAVAQPPPGRRGGPPWRPRRPGRHGEPWLLASSVLVAVAAVALVLLTGIGQRTGTPADQPGMGSDNGAASSPAALRTPDGHSRARAGYDRPAGRTDSPGTAAGTGAVRPAAERAARPPDGTAAPATPAPSASKPSPTPSHSSAGPTSPPATSYARTVPGTQQWTDTGITLHADDRLGITASGEIHVSPSSAAGPAGDPSCTPAVNHPADSAQFPAPGLPCWSLIARIGSGAPFEVGTATRITAVSGELYLGVNDDDFSANSGSWAAAITVG